jgi:hypothetical protein
MSDRRGDDELPGRAIVAGLTCVALLCGCADVREAELREAGAIERAELTESLTLPPLQRIRWDFDGALQVPRSTLRAGDSVALDGVRAFVACRIDASEHCVDRYVRSSFRFGGERRWAWMHVGRMTAPPLQRWEEFGRSIAVDGATLVIGSPGLAQDDNAGAVYVYERIAGVWEHVDTLTPPLADLEQGDLEFNFGAALGLAGELLVVGANRFDDGKGVAYVYERAGGSFVLRQRLTAPSPASDMNFGQQVAVLGDRVLVSEPGAGIFLHDDGQVWVFRRRGDRWDREQALEVNERGQAPDYFGQAFAVHGQRLAVRSHDRLHLYQLHGARFERTWTREAHHRDTVKPGSVAMDGRSILVGYPGAADGTTPAAGLVMSYAHAANAVPITLRSPSRAAHGSFGRALALDGELSLLTAPDQGGAGRLSCFERTLQLLP